MPVAVIRPPRGLAMAAQILIVAAAVLHAADTVGEWRTGWPAVFGALDYLVLFVAAGVFIAWLHQAWANAAVIAAPRPMPWSPGWTIGSWFIPAANFVLPFMVVLSVVDASAGWRTSSRRFVALWWLLFLLAEVIGRVPPITFFHREYAGQLVVSSEVRSYSLHSELPLWLVMTAVEAVAATLAVLLVRRVTDTQTAAALARAGVTP
ncbi:DUF4328 domain-containing protein [Kutzneria sp. NPDC052558]|uniref:DUF4328 domain-containing protein n=1 Tax=Kutzneria sp. NPDC052558 TaxID=3364121 RepID=UPI0037C51A0A